jgi:hypothetical protein
LADAIGVNGMAADLCLTESGCRVASDGQDSGVSGQVGDG